MNMIIINVIKTKQEKNSINIFKELSYQICDETIKWRCLNIISISQEWY